MSLYSFGFPASEEYRCDFVEVTDRDCGSIQKALEDAKERHAMTKLSGYTFAGIVGVLLAFIVGGF